MATKEKDKKEEKKTGFFAARTATQSKATPTLSRNVDKGARFGSFFGSGFYFC